MEIAEALRIVQADYCPRIYQSTAEQTNRDLFKVGLVAPRVGATLCDVGGGLGAFGPACALLGMKVTLIDDFKDPINHEIGDAGFLAHRKQGVAVITADAACGLPLHDDFDVITCFASIEHYHNSPRRMLLSMMEHLKPGGRFVLSAPNGLDLMKRIETALGIARWSPLEEWYSCPEFRGHVREPSIADLKFIARDIGLEQVRVIGKSFIWVKRPTTKLILESIARVVDFWPSLSTELFLIGNKARP